MAGIGVERGGLLGTQPLRRMPWHAVESVAYEGASAAIVVRGLDETGAQMVVAARLESQPQAAAWIVREARARVPGVVNVSDEIALPEVRSDAGERANARSGAGRGEALRRQWDHHRIRAGRARLPTLRARLSQGPRPSDLRVRRRRFQARSTR